jgi:hypothetical protein
VEEMGAMKHSALASAVALIFLHVAGPSALDLADLGDPWRLRQTEREVKRFVLLHYGFEKPTPDFMKAWGSWFESIADRTIENVGFSGGREVSASGTKDLPIGMDSITGYSLIEAESLDEAEKIAQENPYVASIRVYEVRSM